MPEPDALRTLLAAQLTWADAHIDFADAAAAIAAPKRGQVPANVAHSPWQLIEHMRLAQRDILDFCRAPDYREAAWPDDFWPAEPAPPTAGAWDESVAAFLADRDAMVRLISDPANDLFAPIPWGDGQSLLREALLLADHSSYHVGQLMTVRRLLER